jgi:hypothetical protein
MLIRFTRGTALGGVDNDAQPGQVCDLPTAEARALIRHGRAVEVQDLTHLVAVPIPAAAAKRKPTPKA